MNHFEKESLGLFPTPMYRLPGISRELGTNVWIKRDDLCGVALGGNKVRKLEYLLSDAKAKGYDLVMTEQSCHADCRLCSAPGAGLHPGSEKAWCHCTEGQSDLELSDGSGGPVYGYG